MYLMVHHCYLKLLLVVATTDKKVYKTTSNWARGESNGGKLKKGIKIIECDLDSNIADCISKLGPHRWCGTNHLSSHIKQIHNSVDPRVEFNL